MLGFFLEAETLILPDSVQKAQWKQIVERFTSLDAETFLRDFTGQVIWVSTVHPPTRSLKSSVK